MNKQTKLKEYEKISVQHRVLHKYDPLKWQTIFPQRRVKTFKVTYEEHSFLCGMIKWTRKLNEEIVEDTGWYDEQTN